MEARVLDLLLERLAELRLVGSGGRQRTDSTHVLAAVRSLNRLEFIGETLRAVLEALAAAAPDWLRARWTRRGRNATGRGSTPTGCRPTSRSGAPSPGRSPLTDTACSDW
ncbi:hypothetical protein [Streptomyces bobili]